MEPLRKVKSQSFNLLYTESVTSRVTASIWPSNATNKSMDFSLPNLFVVQTGNTIPTTGTTQNLTPNQFGIFLPNYTPATAANSAAADFIFAALGHPAAANNPLNLPSRKGEWISKSNVLSLNLITGTSTGTNQISTITNFVAKAGNQYSILVRAFSSLLNASSKNGWNEVFTVNGPCLDCGDDPCAALDAAATEALVDAFILQMQRRTAFSGYLTFTKTGSGLTSGITVTGVTQAGFPQNCDLNANPYELDVVSFDIFAQVDPPTTMDYSIPSPCDEFATVTVTQLPSFPRGTYGEVRQAEINYYSYTVPKFSQLYSNPNFNGLFTLNAQTGVVYDQLVIRAIAHDRQNNFGNYVRQEFTNILYVPTSQTAAIRAILEPALGTFKNVTP